MGKLALTGGTPLRTKPFSSWPIWDEREEKALLEVLHSGAWGLGGTKIDEIQKAFAAYQHAEYGIAVMNGTVTMIVGLLAAGVGPGDEVIVPPYTFMATASSVVAVGAKPIFVDIDPTSLCIDPDAIEPAITERTKAVIPVHVGGHPADMDRILPIAKKHNLTVIEDCAHAHGSEWNGRRVGAIGDMGSFSFQGSKNLNAGEGGMILTNNKDLADMCYAVHNCGRFRGGARWTHPVLGQNYRMTEFQAAILLAQLTRLDEQGDIRDANGRYLNQELAKIGGVPPLCRDARNTRNCYHMYVFKYEPQAFKGLAIEQFIKAMHAEGVWCGKGYGPLYKEEMWKSVGFDYSDTCCPQAEKALTEVLWMMQTQLLGTKEDMDDIVGAMRKIKENVDELL